MHTWTPQVFKQQHFGAIVDGFGLVFYILLGVQVLLLTSNSSPKAQARGVSGIRTRTIGTARDSCAQRPKLKVRAILAIPQGILLAGRVQARVRAG